LAAAGHSKTNLNTPALKSGGIAEIAVYGLGDCILREITQELHEFT
jgi:hypothetical protein